MTTEQMISSSPAIQSTTIAFSENYILTVGGVLNIYKDLTLQDCEAIIATHKLKQIQFGSELQFPERTLKLINDFLLKDNKPIIRFVLNDLGAFKNLDCLEFLPNLKALTIDLFKHNEIEKINRFVKLEKLAIGGEGISLKEILNQNEITELFVFGNLKDIEVIGKLKTLKKLTFSLMTLKSLDFLKNLDNLTELHFMLGGTKNLEALAELDSVEILSFTRVRQLVISHLLPINKMKNLKKITFDSQPHLIDLDWLENKNLKVEVINCKNFISNN